jgi:hypothetical protein
MPSKAPALPQKGKAAGKKAAPTSASGLPVLSAQFITLEDGSQVRLGNVIACVGSIMRVRGRRAHGPPCTIWQCALPPAPAPRRTAHALFRPQRASRPSPPATQVPIKIPPGMSSEQALAVMEYLKSNPQAAKAALQQAQQVMQRPDMAAMMFGGQVGRAPTRARGPRQPERAALGRAGAAASMRAALEGCKERAHPARPEQPRGPARGAG